MALAQFEYLVCCSLELLNCQSHRWRTVCYPAITPGNWQTWGRGEHFWTLPVNSIHENFKKLTHSGFEKNAKGTHTFIDKGYYESSDSWLHFYYLFRVAS